MELLKLLFVSLLWMAITTITVVSGQQQQQEQLDCSLRDNDVLAPWAFAEGHDDVFIRHLTNPYDETITIEFTYAGLGWIGFAFSLPEETNTMVNHSAIIGLPDTGLVEKYALQTQAPDGSGVVRIGNVAQQAMVLNKSIVQNDTHTVLTFTKPLEEPYPSEVKLHANGMSFFIWAVGASNELGYHKAKGDGYFNALLCSEQQQQQQQQGENEATTTAKVDAATSPDVATAAADETATTTDAAAATAASTTTTLNDDVDDDDDYICFTDDDEDHPYIVVEDRGDVFLRQASNVIDQTISIELTYAGLGWIGFAFTTPEENTMIPHVAIIGLPETGTVEKYALTSQVKDGSGVTRIVNELQQSSLTHTSITQNDTHTVLRFTKPLVEAETSYGETSVHAEGLNFFIWAVGESNDLAYHHARGASYFNTQQCSSSSTSSTNNNETTTAAAAVVDETTKSLDDSAIDEQVNDDTSVDIPGAATTTTDVTLNGCPLGDPIVVEDRGDVFLREVTTEDEIMIELTYAGLGWIAFAFTLPDHNNMVPNTAVIGLPDTGVVEKYALTSQEKDGSGVTRIMNEAQQQQATLRNQYIYQNETHTVMRFSRSLVVVDAEEEVNIHATGLNFYIWAVGETNELAYHKARGAGYINTVHCVNGADVTTGGVVPPVDSSTTDTTTITTSTGGSDTGTTYDDAAAPTTTTTTTLVSSGLSADCAFRGTYMVEDRGDVFLRQVTDESAGRVTIELTYEGLGWVGFAFSEGESMLPNIAIIGLPNTGEVDKYALTSKDYYGAGVKRIENAEQQASLTNKSIVQNATHTILTFTKPLREPETFGEVEVDGTGTNTFIWAVGNGNNLAYHKTRGSDQVDFVVCGEDPIYGDESQLVVVDETVEDEEEGAVAEADQAPVPETLPPLPVIEGRFNGDFILEDGEIKLSIEMDEEEETISVEMSYEGDAWIGFAFTSDRLMAGSTAVIGVDGKAEKYDLVTNSPTAQVERAAEERQTLTDASFTQDGKKSVLKFTKALVESGETHVFMQGENLFLYAIGADNTLAHHVKRGSFSLKLRPCEPDNEDCNRIEVTEDTRRMWKLHGIFMALSWAILVPLGIASSLLRGLLPTTGAWFYFHRGLNTVGAVFTLIGFILAFRATGIEGIHGHFASVVAHRHAKLGFFIFLMVMMQVFGGFFRPAAPVQRNDETKNLMDHQMRADDDEPTAQRLCWEVLHLLFGITLIGMAWHNCHTGTNLYADRYGPDMTFQFWVTVFAVCGSTSAMYIFHLKKS